ncbi:MAG: hypothetical protein NVSMB23_00310 [Myxococcales bacterium]
MRGSRPPRGLTWVSFLLLVLVAAGGYWAFVFGPVYLDHAEVKQFCAQAGNMAYTEHSDAAVKAFVVNHIRTKFAYEELLSNGMTKTSYKIDFDPDQDVRIERSALPPKIDIEVSYGRTVALPILGGARTVNFLVHTEQDLSTVKW